MIWFGWVLCLVWFYAIYIYHCREFIHIYILNINDLYKHFVRNIFKRARAHFFANSKNGFKYFHLFPTVCLLKA